MKHLTIDRFFEPPPSRTTIDIVDGILRLSTKYDIPFLHQRALRHLDLPMCLQDFDALNRRRKTLITNPSAFQTADLVHEMDLQWSLPMILYACTLSIEGVVAGYMHRGERRWMNRSLQELCLKAVKPLMHWYRKDILGFLYRTNIDGCQSFARCLEGRLTLAEEYFAYKYYHPLGSFSDMYETAVQEAVCTTCYTASRHAHLAAREALWEALPGLFDLPSWETLRTRREQALTIAQMHPPNSSPVSLPNHSLAAH